jgi:hypothetical protein
MSTDWGSEGVYATLGGHEVKEPFDRVGRPMGWLTLEVSDDLRIDFDRGMLHFGFCGHDALPITAEYLALLRRVFASDLPEKMLKLGQRYNEDRGVGMAERLRVAKREVA